MILYNTTFHIEADVYEDCLNHLKMVYMKRASESKYLTSPVMQRVMQAGGQEMEGENICIQFRVKSVDDIHNWLSEMGQELQQELIAKYQSKVAGFTTLLEVVEWE